MDVAISTTYPGTLCYSAYSYTYSSLQPIFHHRWGCDLSGSVLCDIWTRISRRVRFRIAPLNINTRRSNVNCKWSRLSYYFQMIFLNWVSSSGIPQYCEQYCYLYIVRHLSEGNIICDTPVINIVHLGEGFTTTMWHFLYITWECLLHGKITQLARVLCPTPTKYSDMFSVEMGFKQTIANPLISRLVLTWSGIYFSRPSNNRISVISADFIRCIYWIRPNTLVVKHIVMVRDHIWPLWSAQIMTLLGEL